MDFSCACHTFLRLSIPMRSGVIDYKFSCRDAYLTERMCTRNERRSIKKSAKHCKLCQQIYKYLHRTHGSDLYLPGRGNLLHVLARMSLLNGDAIRVSSIEFGDPNRASRLKALHFAVWADRGMLSVSQWSRAISDLDDHNRNTCFCWFCHLGANSSREDQWACTKITPQLLWPSQSMQTQWAAWGIRATISSSIYWRRQRWYLCQTRWNSWLKWQILCFESLLGPQREATADNYKEGV